MYIIHDSCNRILIECFVGKEVVFSIALLCHGNKYC
jgi:hypothetical protein